MIFNIYLFLLILPEHVSIGTHVFQNVVWIIKIVYQRRSVNSFLCCRARVWLCHLTSLKTTCFTHVWFHFLSDNCSFFLWPKVFVTLYCSILILTESSIVIFTQFPTSITLNQIIFSWFAIISIVDSSCTHLHR